MKAHIREEKETATLELGKGTLFQNKDGKIYKVCDTVEYDEIYTDEEVIKVALSEENMIHAMNFQSVFDNLFVFTD
nr:MAG TPA: hypothetical protein [Caudoviricetes sp.]